MAVTFVAASKFTPAASATTRILVLPPDIQAGDTILIHSVQPGGSTTVSPSGLTNLSDVGNQAFSGHRQYLWIKESADAADAGASVTFTSSSALRITVECIVFRGTPSTAVIDVWAGANGAAGGGTSITSPTLTTTAANTLEVQFVGAAGASGATAFTVPSSLTKAIDSYDAGTAGGVSHGVIAYIPTAQASGSNPGNDVWTLNSSNLLSAFTVALKPSVAATSVRPTVLVAATGVSAVGAGTIPATLADESDTTYAETVDNPSGSTVTVSFPALGSGAITTKTRNQASAATPTITRTFALMQGSTVIASRSITLSTTATDYEFTTTAAELANVTDPSALRLRTTDTV